MKLWLKTAIAVGVVSAATASTIGGVYLFNKHSNSANGKGYASLYSLQNQYPKEAWDASGNLKNENDIKQYLDVHFYKPSDVITSNAGQYDFKTDSVNGVPYEAWKQSFISKNQTPPAMVVFFGATAFTNDYVDAVSPADFTEYVAWFITNVPWSGDLGSLERFNIKRGIQQDGSAIILGAHENKNKERQEINFYPDAFFGSLPGYSIQAGRGQMADNLLIKMSNKNGQLLRKSEIEVLAKNSNNLGMAYWMMDKGATALPTGKYNNFKIRYIKPVDLVDSLDANGKPIPGKREQGYEVYADEYAGNVDQNGSVTDNLIDNVAKKFPYLLDEVEGYHVVNGQLVYGKYKTVTTNTRIPFLSVLASNPSTATTFKGPGINWLKYVGAHEYGHHTTLNTGQDASGDHEYSGAFGTNAGLNPTMLYSRDMQNLYLLARSQHLLATGASVTGDQKDSNGEFIGFLHQTGTTTTAEKVEDIYGTKQPVDDITAAANPQRRAAMTLDELKKVANNLNLSLFDLFIENAWDTRSGTINPGLTAPAHTYDANKFGELQEVTEAYLYGTSQDSAHPEIYSGGLLKDPAGNSINYVKRSDGTFGAFVQTYADGTPAVYTLDPTTNTFSIKAHNGSTVVTTILKKEDKTTPLVANDDANGAMSLVSRINSFVGEFEKVQKINGWDSGDTVTVGETKAALGIVSTGIYHPMSYWTHVGEGVANIVASIGGQGMYTLNSTKGIFNKLTESDMTDLLNVDFRNGSDISLGAEDETITMNDFSKLLCYNMLNSVEFGEKQGQGTAVYTSDNTRYTMLPDGDNSQTARSTMVGFISRHVLDLNGSARQHGQPLRIVYTDPSDSTHKENQVFVQAKHTNAGFKMVTKPDGTWSLASVQESDNLIPYYLDSNNQRVNLKSTDSMRIKFDDTGLVNSLKNAAKEFNVSLVSGSLLNHDLSSITSIKDYLDKFNVNPLEDFETVTLKSGQKVSVLTKQALSKFYGTSTDAFACFDKQAANYDENVARQVLTKAIFDSETLSIKDITTDYANLSASQTSSLFAMLSGAGDSQTLHSKECVIPQSLVIPSITYNKLTNIDDFIKAISSFKTTTSTLWTNPGTTTMSFLEFSMFAGQQVYTSDSASVMLAELNIKGSLKIIVGPSDDIKDILSTRVDDKFGEKFSDYSYNPSESINRDWLQITYLPSVSGLENTPDFLRVGSQLPSEATTGFNYYIDASSTKNYLMGAMSTRTLASTIASFVEDPSLNKDAIPGLVAIGKSGDEEGLSSTMINSFDSNYIGTSGNLSDGFFADDFLRRSLNNELYDLHGNAMAIDPKDLTVISRIKDFALNKQGNYDVTDRVRATWVSAMKSQGVGSRTLSALWRSPDRDASYMYGFVPYSTQEQKDAVSSITHVRFTDINTGEVKLLPVHTRQNNLFYYEDRVQQGSTLGHKHTLEQDGYTSWQTDYAAFGGYRDAMLTSGHNYKAEFWDNNGQKVVDQNGVKLTMGDTTQGTDTYPDATGQPVQVNTGRQYICENGKLFGQASTYFEQVLTTQSGSEYFGTKAEVGDSVLHVNNQFNG